MDGLDWRVYYYEFVLERDGYYIDKALDMLFPKDLDGSGLLKALAQANVEIRPFEWRRATQAHVEGKYGTNGSHLAAIIMDSPLKAPYQEQRL